MRGAAAGSKRDYFCGVKKKQHANARVLVGWLHCLCSKVPLPLSHEKNKEATVIKLLFSPLLFSLPPSECCPHHAKRASLFSPPFSSSFPQAPPYLTCGLTRKLKPFRRGRERERKRRGERKPTWSWNPGRAQGRGKKGRSTRLTLPPLSLSSYGCYLFTHISTTMEGRRGEGKEACIHICLPSQLPSFFFRPLLEEPGNAPSIMILINCVWEELKGEEERERE